MIRSEKSTKNANWDKRLAIRNQGSSCVEHSRKEKGVTCAGQIGDVSEAESFDEERRFLSMFSVLLQTYCGFAASAHPSVPRERVW